MILFFSPFMSALCKGLAIFSQDCNGHKRPVFCPDFAQTFKVEMSSTFNATPFSGTHLPVVLLHTNPLAIDFRKGKLVSYGMMRRHRSSRSRLSCGAAKLR